MLTTTDGNRLDGCQFNAASPKDYRLQFGEDALPQQVDLRPHCTAVEDQGRIGSCTANAAVGALEHAYVKRDGRSPELSRLYVYFNTRRIKGTIQQDTGAGINEAMASIMAFGACEAGHWPYDPGRFTEEPPRAAYENGSLHEPIQYARVPGPAGALHALANGYTVVYGTFMPQRCYEEAARTGTVPATTQQERTGQPGGGHCMLIVGYDLGRRMFIVRNSWGAGWGKGGYCEIPFEEMTYWSPPETFWMLLELEPKQGSFSVVRPSVEGAPAPTSAAMGGASLGTSASSLRAGIGGDLRASLDAKTADIRARFDRMGASLNAGAAPSAAACGACSGSGKCYSCGGTGKNLGGMCMACRGSGTCHTCGGKG